MSVRNGINFPKDATHSPPVKTNIDKTVTPLSQRPGGADHPKTVKPEPEPVKPKIVRGVEDSHPCKNVYTPLPKKEKKNPAKKVEPRKDAPLSVRMARAAVAPPVEAPEPVKFVRGVDAPKIDTWHPSHIATKTPASHQPSTPSLKDTSVTPMEQRRGYVKVEEPEKKSKIVRGVEDSHPCKNVYTPLPKKEKKPTKKVESKRDAPLSVRMEQAAKHIEPEVIKPYKHVPATADRNSPPVGSHPARNNAATHSTPQPENLAGRQSMVGRVYLPPEPVEPEVINYKHVAATANRNSGPTTIAKPRMLTFNEFAGEEYTLLRRVINSLIIARRGISVSGLVLSKLPPSALTADGLVYEGRVYAIDVQFHPNETYLIPGPWGGDVGKWYQATQKAYDSYVLDFSEVGL